MMESLSRRAGLIAAAVSLAAIGLAATPAHAQYRYGGYGPGPGYGYYRYGGYGPRYDILSGYPDSYYAPQPYPPAPRVIYLRPPHLRYAAPVRRVVHQVPLPHAVKACTCTLPKRASLVIPHSEPRLAFPVKLPPAPHHGLPPAAFPPGSPVPAVVAPAAPSVVAPAAPSVVAPPPTAPAPVLPPITFEPRPSIGD